ncbi:DNA ejectosome component, peptidoglycan lytic exotransglycosylase [Pseudomonas phage MR6]|uniref:DNA ejectosome component, peptidoglycan lytic exotransglycosylase n=1 Tax=Pseudomonas phage MR5 TaxID=2711172 RepID=A0A6M3TCV2_9CAUD|nr:DNA ejectosome component, peptidoglycan lytic exotransglycosylase [Pseudomonas phage MR5]QJD54874.1 DNA ejectosome component, peptidoglycan lytic exotransglycosylase [Pseudomonas phage MR6]QJD54934.1 DNA ejectosome component, peptidoglycan lytic exotransglycosylase [Pseudomonas phage MR7]QJD54992.1 putative internal virion protein [Pseudomonas phage MR8]QJD55049.1 putative internal virion protein [Pseudomonas phage MR12]
MASKGSLNVKDNAAIPLDALQAALNREDPTGLSANADAVTGGPEGVAVQEKYQRIQEQPLEAAQLEAKDSLADKAKAAWEESYTSYILEATDRAQEKQYGDFDPTFQGTRRAQELVSRMGLNATPENLQLLAEAGNEDDQLDVAQRLAQHQTNQEILNRHGGFALASGMLDPATLLTDFATFGATRAFKLSRLAGATLGATAGTALVGAADAAGKSTTGFDYVLNAAVMGGFGALFGGGGLGGIAGSGGWAGSLTIPGANGKVGRSVNAFLSETDKLAKATPEAGPVMANLVDDPVRRAGLLTNNNAASFHRRFSNEADGYMQSYDSMLEQGLKSQQGWGFLARRVDLNGKYGMARDGVNREVAEELLRRNDEWQKFGTVSDVPNQNPLIKQLADESDRIHGRIGEQARDAGVRGFENFQKQPGYFHRSWNDSFIRGMDNVEEGLPKRLIAASAMKGFTSITQDEADAIATALIQRVKDKAAGTRSDFLGGLGKTDTAFLRESLEATNMPPAKIDSLMFKIEQKASDQGTTKYGKHRLSFDMTTSIKGVDGNDYRMADLIDTDIDRVMENYTSSMAGRMALAKAGVAGDDAGLEAFKRSYLESIKSLPQGEQSNLMQQLDGFLGDFTGNRPEANILGPVAQRMKAIADATMLSGSGLWQVAEYSTIAARHGFVESGKAFMKAFPGVRNVLNNAASNPDLADELRTVMHLDLARDVRVRPWKRQHDVNLAAGDTSLDRLLHAGKQAVPFLNAMKYIHANQSRMNANLVLNKMARAAQGDTKALAQIKSYAPDMDWAKTEAAMRANVTYIGKNAKSMNWASWPKEELDATMNVALRMMDDSILFGRVGQGSSFSRSAVGQVLGQFQSFVSFAHNKILRGSLQNGGPKALATVLAYQYPATFLMVSLNETRKGKLELNDAGLKKIAKGALGYTAGLGFIGGAASIVGLTGGRAGMSVPLTGIMDAPSRALGGANKMLNGEYREGSADIGKAATQVIPFINAMPGTATVLNAWKGE